MNCLNFGSVSNTNLTYKKLDLTMLDLIEEHRSLITFIGLTLNIIGSILFIIDSKKLFGWLTYMTTHMAEDHGKFDGQKFSREEMEKFNERVQNSRTLTLWGLWLFFFGFFIQLIPNILK